MKLTRTVAGAAAVLAVLAIGASVFAQQTPYPGPNPAPMAGKIEAENYDAGGEGVAYHDTTAGNSGGAYRADDVDIVAGGSNNAVTDIDTGEWLEYTVTFAASGVYRTWVRYASANASTDFASTFHLELDGVAITGPMMPAGRGSATSFADFACPQFYATAGDHVFRFQLDQLIGSGMVVDYFFISAEPQPPQSNWAAYYRFEIDPDRALSSPGAVTRLIDDSFNHNDGTPAGSPSSLLYGGNVPFPASRPGTVAFTGFTNNKGVLELVAAEGDYFSVPDSDSLDFGNARSFTIQAYVQLFTLGDISGTRCWLVQKKVGVPGVSGDPDANTDYGFLVGAGNFAAAPTWTNLTTPATGRELALVFGSPGGVQVALSTLAIPIPDDPLNPPWYYVAASYDAVNGKAIFVLDQVADVITGVTPGNTTNTGPLWVGAHINSSGQMNQFLDANIDELLISTTPLEANYPTRKWFWEWQGGEPQGVFNADGKKVMDFYHMIWSDFPFTLPSSWQSLPVPGEPGNFSWVSTRATRQTRYFYDQTYFTGAAPNADNSIAPESRGTGSTLAMRFKIPYFTATDATRECKFIRIFNYLQGTTAADNFMQWNILFDTLTPAGNIVLQNGAISGAQNDPARITPPVSDRYHTLWQVSRVEGTGVRCKVWFDGQLIQNYLRTAVAGSRQDFYILPNDNNRRHETVSDVDFMKFAVDKDYYLCDFDMDGDVDLADFGQFQTCFNGPNQPAASVGCEEADIDSDGDVDLSDFGAFQGCFNGPNRPPACM